MYYVFHKPNELIAKIQVVYIKKVKLGQMNILLNIFAVLQKNCLGVRLNQGHKAETKRINKKHQRKSNSILSN